MPDLTRKQLNYIVACVSKFACRNSLSQDDTFAYLDQYRGISFLNEYYDVEHTLSMDESSISIEEALRCVYTSETFKKLTNPDTGLYLDASSSVYSIFRDERLNGRIVQNEV